MASMKAMSPVAQEVLHRACGVIMVLLKTTVGFEIGLLGLVSDSERKTTASH